MTPWRTLCWRTEEPTLSGRDWLLRGFQGRDDWRRWPPDQYVYPAYYVENVIVDVLDVPEEIDY